MATLVLSAVGSLLGPVGTILGAVAGNAIDREVLFKPKGREGPRLSELKIQTSSYGTPIPRLFGTLRVAGSVIWSTDLIEHRATERGGKGRPSVTSYSYSASFAVALSARPVLGVRRIWADGKLLRGSAGDFKARLGSFRLHRGDEDQPVDPLIAAAEGIGMTPAHRGLGYAVFEDLALEEFGNRIPALTFEVEADTGPVTAGAAIAALGGGLIASESGGLTLQGFSAHGDSLRAAIETLAGADGGWFAAAADGFLYRRGEGAAVTVADAGVAEGDRRGARGSRTIAGAGSAPRALSLAHYDPARDYQIGVQRASRPGAGGREARVELPAALEADSAKAVAGAALSRMDHERERRSVTLGWQALDVGPGTRVTIAGVPGLWRVDRWMLERMVVTLECVAVSPAGIPVEASAGRVLSAPDLTAGSTIVHCFELPPLGEDIAATPRLAIAAAGTGPGWRSAALLLSGDEGTRWTSPGRTALPAVLGEIVAAPRAAPADLADMANRIEVELAHAGMALADADAAGLDAGANLALAGDELIQFGRAERIDARRWRLSHLWRGRRGTDAAIGLQVPGDRFVLLEADALLVTDLPPAALGGTVQLLADGLGGTVSTSAAIPGISVLPPSPVHLRAEPLADGSCEIRWVRRSRTGWRWIDGADAPLAEETERYLVTVAPEGGAVRLEEASVPMATLAAAECESFCLVTVRQAGTHGLSSPATLLVPPRGETA